jgi:hypothetical protein
MCTGGLKNINYIVVIYPMLRIQHFMLNTYLDLDPGFYAEYQS